MTHPALRRDPADCAHCATRRLCVLSSASHEQLEYIQPLINKRVVRRGDTLAREGEIADVVRVLKIGSAFGYRRGVDGRSRPIGMAMRGAQVGIFGVFEQETQASLVAASPGRVCEIPVPALRELSRRDPNLSQRLSIAAAQSCGRIAVWSEAMRVRGVINQLAYTLLLAEEQGTPVIDLPTHTALAELLGTTRETIARSLATLESERGIQRQERKKCEVYRSALMARLRR